MKNKMILKLVLFFIGSSIHLNGFSQNNCKTVIGYYPNWQWYDRGKLVNPETIIYDNYSILNYSFFSPEADGSISLTDPWADKNLLLGTINWSSGVPAGYDSSYDFGDPAYHNPGTSLIYHAHQNDTKVLASIGGWTLSNDFPSIASNPVTRANFAHYCNELIRVYDFDGIDIDWEYPGFPDHNGTPADYYTYTELLSEIRDSLDVLEIVSGKPLMLTAAVGAAPDRMDDVNWAEVSTILDYINLMSYDFFGTWDPETNHNGPLYAPAVGDSTFNCHSAVYRLTSEYNVPSDRINLGIPYYGRSVTTNGAPTLHGTHTGTVDGATWSEDLGTPLYYNILLKSHLFTEHWDNNAHVPYLLGANGLNSFLSYDNDVSIKEKGQYVVDHNLAGVIIWEITGDYIETAPGSGIISGTPLTDSLNQSLCNNPNNGNSGNGTDSSSAFMDEYDPNQVLLFPNPAGNFVQIKSDGSFRPVAVHNQLGKIVLRLENNQEVVDISSLPDGIYYLEVQNKKQVRQFIKFAKQE